MGRDRIARQNVTRHGVTLPLLLAVCFLASRLVHAETPSPLIADAAAAPPPTAPVAAPAVTPPPVTPPPPSVPAGTATEAQPPTSTTPGTNAPTSPATSVPTAAYEEPADASKAQPVPVAPPNGDQTQPATTVQSRPRSNPHEPPPADISALQPTFADQPAPKDRWSAPEQPREQRPRAWGATLDVGFPDGVILGAAFRPVSVLRLQAGVGTNAVSPGLRAGAVLIPLGMGPSLTLEGGWYFEGNANGIAAQVAGSSYSSNRMADRIGYQYANLHLGLDFGRNNSTFFLHGGMSYVHAKLYNANDVFGGQTADASGGTTIYKINGDPSVNAFLPSFKLGFLFYFV